MASKLTFTVERVRMEELVPGDCYSSLGEKYWKKYTESSAIEAILHVYLGGVKPGTSMGGTFVYRVTWEDKNA